MRQPSSNANEGLAAFGAVDSARRVVRRCRRIGLIINYTLSPASPHVHTVIQLDIRRPLNPQCQNMFAYSRTKDRLEIRTSSALTVPLGYIQCHVSRHNFNFSRTWTKSPKIFMFLGFRSRTWSNRSSWKDFILIMNNNIKIFYRIHGMLSIWTKKKAHHNWI